MSGFIGIDVQASMAVVAVASGAGGSAAVSDGVRSPFPVAVAPGAWASAAAAERLGDGRLGFHGEDADLYAWACPRFDHGFLSGMARRVAGHLAVPVLGAGCDLRCALVDLGPVERGEPPLGQPSEDAAAALARAGFPLPMMVDPADAVLCRALGAPGGQLPSAGPPFAGPLFSGPPFIGQPFTGPAVTVVACGECWTVVRRYQLERDGERVVPRVGPGAVLSVGSRLWSTEMALRVLRQREEVPARSVLGVLWGLQEYAAALRLVAPDTLVPWSGPVPSPAFAPLRFSISSCLKWPTVSAFVEAVRAAACDQGGAQDQLVVGGVGAMWPFVDAAFAAGRPPPWRSPSPALDLAVGAAYFGAGVGHLGTDGAAGARAWAPSDDLVTKSPAVVPVPPAASPGLKSPAPGDYGGYTAELPPSERRSW
ncbi:MAG TPA: hypothetical protein VME46_01110 [Acidimicrobiales bacterium]|nr:hypothetical protein [Acidimicrobiales bacterium]